MASKRVLDVLFAVVGLVIASPVMALVALAVRLTSPGPVFYHQQRVGLHGQIFTVHKFRTMRADAEAETGPVWAVEGRRPASHAGRSGCCAGRASTSCRSSGTCSRAT